MELFIATAMGLTATTYGWGEMMCGDIGKPRSCASGAVTASGQPFLPTAPSAAVPAPTKLRITATYIDVKLKNVVDAPCVRIIVNDKSNPRWIGQRGFDLSPAAVQALTQKMPMPYWSGELEECTYYE